MRIGVLTFHRAINYGAVMQAYSMVERLKRDFPQDSVEIIDYNCAAREWFKLKCPLVFVYRRGLKQAWQKMCQTRIFNKFVKTLPLSRNLVWKGNKKVQSYIAAHYDVVVVGSDAVFNWNDLGLPNVYFLADAQGVCKMSYAASAHLQFFDRVTEEQKAYLCKCLTDFQYIGVRDENTKKFVTDVTGGKQTALHNCDPTVFLQMDFPEMALQRKLKKHGFDFKKKTVFVMLMHPTYAQYARRYFGEDVQIVALMDGNREADIYLHDLNPFEWAHVLKLGACLITDYFHGTLLSLKNGTPVMSIDASGYCNEQYESKARDILVRRLDIPELYVHADELQGEQGYATFARRLDVILNGFDPQKVKNALQAEADSYNSFCNYLKEARRQYECEI